MQIQSITNSYYNPSVKNPGFGYWNREVFKNAADNSFAVELKHRNTTYFYRSELLWKDFIHFFRERFKNVSKVNVYDYGCSDGSEAYTFIMSLLSVADMNEAKKFLPVIAKDYDEFAIKTAKIGSLPITFDEIYKINNNTDFAFRDYFKTDINYPEYFRYNPKPILKDNVVFEVADLREDYKNIKPYNSIVFARNFWPYFGPFECIELVKNLKKTMKNNSYLVIGKFDTNSSDILKYLELYDFKPTEVPFVYKT